MTTLLNSLPPTDRGSKLDLSWVRSQFPSLSRVISGQPAAFLDGPGGTQVTQSVIVAISHYLKTSNANTHGQYATSRETDEVIAGARSAMADFLGCNSDEIIFGPNMTTLTFAISRSIGRELGPRRRNPAHAARSQRQRFSLAGARRTRGKDSVR